MSKPRQIHDVAKALTRPLCHMADVHHPRNAGVTTHHWDLYNCMSQHYKDNQTAANPSGGLCSQSTNFIWSMIRRTTSKRRKMLTTVGQKLHCQLAIWHCNCRAAQALWHIKIILGYSVRLWVGLKHKPAFRTPVTRSHWRCIRMCTNTMTAWWRLT